MAEITLHLGDCLEVMRVAMCIAKYVCRSRGRFHALVESGDDQTPELRGNAD